MSDPAFAVRNLKNYITTVRTYIENSKNAFPLNKEESIKELSNILVLINNYTLLTFYERKETKITQLLDAYKKKIEKFIEELESGKNKTDIDFTALIQEYITLISNMEIEAKNLGISLK